MRQFEIKSISGCIHDTSFGGYPYKVVVEVSLDVKVFNALCPKIGTKGGGFSPKRVIRDLGNLVLDVNNAVYALSPEIPSYNPQVDESSRSKAGIKTVVFTYLFQDHQRAEKIGFKVLKMRNGECWPEYGQHIKIA